MTSPRWFLKRTVFAVLAVYLVLTLLFGAVAFFPDFPTSFGEAALDAGPPDGSPRDADTSLTERYVTWLVKFTTLDWDYGSTGDGPGTTSEVVDALQVTVTYLLPALVVSYAVGLLVGVHAALRRDTRIDRAERLVAYVGFAIPSFFLALVVLYVLIDHVHWIYPYFDASKDTWSEYNLVRMVAPSAVVAVGMIAVQIRHVRSESVKFVDEDFVKLVRAQGAGTASLAAHVLRNAASNLVSLFLTDLLGVVLLSAIAVEVVFNLPGFGNLLLSAAIDRQPELIMGVTVVTVAIGVLGNFLQDAVTQALDPRIESGE